MSAKNRHEWGVLEVSEDVHGAMTGACDPMREVDMEERLKWLRWRVGDGWVPSVLPSWEPYDDAIRATARTLLKLMDADDWAVESEAFHGHVLRGKHSHWCVDWDDLPIDESCHEYHLDQAIPEVTDIPCSSCGFYSGNSGPSGNPAKAADIGEPTP